jgi:hypothetical protein
MSSTLRSRLSRHDGQIDGRGRLALSGQGTGDGHRADRSLRREGVDAAAQGPELLGHVRIRLEQCDAPLVDVARDVAARAARDQPLEEGFALDDGGRGRRCGRFGLPVQAGDGGRILAGAALALRLGAPQCVVHLRHAFPLAALAQEIEPAPSR